MKTRLEAKKSNTFNTKKEQVQYLKDHGCTDIRYSGKKQTFYYTLN